MGCLILLVLFNLALWLLLWAALASEIDGGPGVWGSGGFLLGLLVVLRFWPWCLGCAGQTFGSVCCPSASVAFTALLSLTTSAGWLKLYLHAGISHWCACFSHSTLVFSAGDSGLHDVCVLVIWAKSMGWTCLYSTSFHIDDKI